MREKIFFVVKNLWLKYITLLKYSLAASSLIGDSLHHLQEASLDYKSLLFSVGVWFFEIHTYIACCYNYYSEFSFLCIVLNLILDIPHNLLTCSWCFKPGMIYFNGYISVIFNTFVQSCFQKVFLFFLLFYNFFSYQLSSIKPRPIIHQSCQSKYTDNS